MAALDDATYDAGRLLRQARALDTRAEALRNEARELAREATDLRIEAGRLTRGPLEAAAAAGARGEDPFTARVEAVLDGSGALSMSDLTDHLNATPTRVRAALARLERDGRVARSGIKRGTRYRIVNADDEAARVHDFRTYETMVRDAAVRLDTFEFVDLQRELSDLSEATLRRWLRRLQERGLFEAERVGTTWVYAYVSGDPASNPTHRPRHESPEAEARRLAGPERARGDAVMGTGAMKLGRKEMDDLMREVRAHGVTVKKTHGGHLAWLCPSGATVRTASTPSSSSTDKIRKELRDAGVPV